MWPALAVITAVKVPEWGNLWRTWEKRASTHRTPNTLLKSGPYRAQELRISRQMPEPVQAQPSPSNAEQLTRLLELELIQKRATWNQAKQRNKSFRSLAFLFLFLLIAGSLAGFFFVYMRVSETPPKPPTQRAGH